MKCRHCGQPLHLLFLDLGSPPSNAYLSEAALRAPGGLVPLRVLVCTHRWLVQTEDHAGREALFTHDYAYFSSFSTSWLAPPKPMCRPCSSAWAWARAVAWSRSHRTTATCWVRAAGGHPLLRHRAHGQHGQGGAGVGAGGGGALFGVALADELAGRWPPGRPDRRQQRAGPCAGHQRLCGGFTRLLKPHGVATFEFRTCCAWCRVASSTRPTTSTTRICRSPPCSAFCGQWAGGGGCARAAHPRRQPARLPPGRCHRPPTGRPKAPPAWRNLLATEAAAGLLGEGFIAISRPQPCGSSASCYRFCCNARPMDSPSVPTAQLPKATPCSTLRACGLTCCPTWWTKPRQAGPVPAGQPHPIVNEACARAPARPGADPALNLRDEVASNWTLCANGAASLPWPCRA